MTQQVEYLPTVGAHQASQELRYPGQPLDRWNTDWKLETKYNQRSNITRRLTATFFKYFLAHSVFVYEYLSIIISPCRRPQPEYTARRRSWATISPSPGICETCVRSDDDTRASSTWSPTHPCAPKRWGDCRSENVTVARMSDFAPLLEGGGQWVNLLTNASHATSYKITCKNYMHRNAQIKA